MKRKISNVLFGLLFLVGFGILAYPTISDRWNAYRQSKLISDYEEAVAQMAEEDFEEAMELQNIRGEQLEFFTEEYDRLVEESGEHLKVPEDLAERLYELEREYYRNTRYA